jgi:hypothetical protein
MHPAHQVGTPDTQQGRSPADNKPTHLSLHKSLDLGIAFSQPQSSCCEVNTAADTMDAFIVTVCTQTSIITLINKQIGWLTD